MKGLEDIKYILNEQINGYSLLLEKLRKEKECLISLDTYEIENLAKEKDIIILKLRLLEEERIRITNRLKIENNLIDDISLQGLSEITGDEFFQKARLKLISLCQAISEINEFNRILIDRSMSLIKNAVATLGALGVNMPLKNNSSFLSKEV